jgi:signal transduction histidine kinase
MTSHLRHWIQLAALLIWLAVGLPVLATDLVVPPDPWWWVAYLGYGALLGIGLLPTFGRRIGASGWTLLAQVVAGCAAFALDGGYGFSSVLIVLSAGAAALVLPLGQTLALVAIQALVMLVSTYARGHGPTDLTPVAEAGVFAGFQLFTVAMVEVGRRERRQRAELAALTVGLAAAQARLAESSRAAERLRIARDMHDTIGHQLTAIAVHLEVALHLLDGPAREHVGRSRQLAKQALGEVRATVGQMREQPVDLATAFAELFAAVPGLAIHVAVPRDLPPTDPARADALVRCGQEIVTNTVRHADAENVWITVRQDRDAVVLTGRDDGLGGAGFRMGNGLRGMRERLAQFGGTVDFVAGNGFRVEARLPAW